jgi:uncharacterized membrane protein
MLKTASALFGKIVAIFLLGVVIYAFYDTRGAADAFVYVISNIAQFIAEIIRQLLNLLPQPN